MSRCIVKFRDLYFEWSSVTDSPVTYGMTEAQLRRHIKRQYGKSGLLNLEFRMERILKYGTSSMTFESAEDLIRNNRAGKNMEPLTEDELWSFYAHPPKKEAVQ